LIKAVGNTHILKKISTGLYKLVTFDLTEEDAAVEPE
jgi:hypothetical protein